VIRYDKHLAPCAERHDIVKFMLTAILVAMVGIYSSSTWGWSSFPSSLDPRGNVLGG
jgi:hypothetical protein